MSRLHILFANKPEPVDGAEQETHWCFKCRKRLPHRLMVLTGDYYDPEFFWQCTLCNESHIEFPQA